VNSDPTVIPELRETATSMLREAGSAVQREALLASICNELESLMGAGQVQLIERYRGMSLILDRRVRVEVPGGEAYAAMAVSIADDGTLVVRRDDGSLESVTSADVSLRPA
jgi:BirA family biotin operon repressor/biotin-[acetyl-CoA-carboxylase] ligase